MHTGEDANPQIGISNGDSRRLSRIGPDFATNRELMPTQFVLDEVQTGVYRTGTFLAAHQFGLQADMVVLAKALSGGLMPVSAVLMTDKVYKSVYSSLKRAIVHTSTFGENSLSMRAGLATLDVLEREKLGARALQLGDQFRQKLMKSISPAFDGS